MDRPQSESTAASAFLAELTVDAEGDIRLAVGGSLFELLLAGDDSPVALREVCIGGVDATEFGPWGLSP